MVRKYYGRVDITLHPLLTTGELSAISDPDAALADWRAARQRTENLRAEAEKISAECAEQRIRRVGLISAHCLAKAGFKLESTAFGLPESATSPGEQETAARRALEEASAAMLDRLAKLEPFMAALRQRVTLALRLAQANRSVSNAEGAGALAELAPLLAAVGAEMARTHEIGAKLNAFRLLAQNRDNYSNPAEVDEVVAQLVAELQFLIGEIQGRLNRFTYPFPHARGRLTVAEYARSEKSAENDWQRAYLDGDAHVDRLFALHYRLIGRILAQSDAVETSLEAQ